MNACYLCAGQIETQPNGWDRGHNGWPLAPDEFSVCGECNMAHVLPARIALATGVARRVSDHSE